MLGYLLSAFGKLIIAYRAMASSCIRVILVTLDEKIDVVVFVVPYP